nr:hypothetical protein [uncultured Gellertiella sp.]
MAKTDSKQTAWEFTEDFDVSVAPPEGPTRAPRRFEMPFAPKLFTPALPLALEGKKPHKFVPKSFFVGRSEKPEQVDVKYMRQKIRAQWNKWLKLQSKEAQEQLTLLIIPRDGKQTDFPEEGVSIWIMKAEKTNK